MGLENNRCLMVSELVETSRLFGRVAARIDPKWVEPLAGHLVNRSYSEPRWDPKRAAVVKAGVKVWLKDNDFAADVSVSLTDLISGRISNEYDRRKARRIFEDLEEPVDVLYRGGGEQHGDFLLDLGKDALGRPGRVGHELLQFLAVVVQTDDTAGHVGVVAVGGQEEQATQIDRGPGTGIACLGGEAVVEALPAFMQTLSQVLDRGQGQAPAFRVEDVRAQRGPVCRVGHRWFP